MFFRAVFLFLGRSSEKRATPKQEEGPKNKKKVPKTIKTTPEEEKRAQKEKHSTTATPGGPRGPARACAIYSSPYIYSTPHSYRRARRLLHQVGLQRNSTRPRCGRGSTSGRKAASAQGNMEETGYDSGAIEHIYRGPARSARRGARRAVLLL